MIGTVLAFALTTEEYGEREHGRKSLMAE